MTQPITRATLFVPGEARSKQEWEPALGRVKGDIIDIEWIANDGAFGDAFSFGTVSSEVIGLIDRAPGALVLRWSSDMQESRKQMVSDVEILRDAGAIAVRLEESKVGWEVSRWLELFSSDDPWLWHRGAVAYLSGDDVLQSCGMHAFSLPDVQVSTERDNIASLQELLSIFNVYQIAEDPLIVSGQTFSPSQEVPKRIVERWPDLGYQEDHACHNPYGVWRLGPPGGSARAVHDPTPVFIPELRVLLAALESKKGEPLTKAEVEAARNQGVCMMMKQRDAQQFERTRGRADLYPELAWEQWQALRQ